MRLSTLACCLIHLLLSAVGAVETVTVTVGTTVRANAGSPLGLNLNYLMDDEAKRPATTTRTLGAAIGDMKMRFLRYPGGEKSDNFLWTTAAGSTAPITRADAVPAPLRPHLVTTEDWWGGSLSLTDASGGYTTPILDFDEFITLCKAQGCEPVVVVAYDNAREFGYANAPTLAQLVESAAAWVKYANITKGYGVKYWEIGNESWFRKGQTAAAYATHLAQYATAMRGVDSTIRIGAHGNSAAWWKTLLSKAASSCDWLAVHDYPCYKWVAGYDTFRTAAKVLTPDVDTAIAAIGARPHTVGVTETNIIDWDAGGWSNLNDLGHALVHFDLIGQQLLRPKVAFTQCWNSRWVSNISYIPGTGANSLGNPGFESGLAGWTGHGGTLTTTAPHSGTQVLQLGGGAYYQHPLSLKPGKTYAVGGWMKTSTKEVWSGLGVDCFDAAGGKIGSFGTHPSAATWGWFSRPFTVPAGTVSAVFWVSSAKGSVSTCFDDLVVSDRVVPEINDAFTPENAYQPIGRALAIWGQFLPERLVQATGSVSVIAYAGTGPAAGQPLVVWLLNKQTAEVPISLVIDGGTLGGRAERWLFSGTSPTDAAPTWAAQAPLAVAASPIALTLPKLSITVLRLAP